LDSLGQLKAEALAELNANILPFSLRIVLDGEHGGFYGYVANSTTVQREAPKALIQHSRMLWTFAHARRFLDDPGCVQGADHARQALLGWFWDAEHGGCFWMVDYRGQPLNIDKFTYGQAFAIYALAEDRLAAGPAECLERAIELYRLVESHCHDAQFGGYFEGCHRDWAPAPELRVDTTDLPVVKSMNVHLHMMEAYSTLLRAWDDPGLRASLQALVEILLDHILDRKRHHFGLWFDSEWHPLADRISYGHDIEGSWLLVEAAEALGDPQLLARAQQAALSLAYATLGRAVDTDGGLFLEGDPTGVTDRDKFWWPQAEAVVGFLNAYQLSGDARFLDATLATWRFIRSYIVDHEHGDWFWGIDAAGRPLDHQKAGPWKAAYHSGRMCMEVMERVERLAAEGREA
jgi:mannobiose 2-epimerase